MKEQIVTGKKFRILADVTSRLWHVISFWTKAQDVEFNDGSNAQAKLGNIVGISDSLTSTASNVAASAKAVKVLNDKVVNQIGNLNDQIVTKNNAINDLNSQIANKNNTIHNLNAQIVTLNELISNLQNTEGLSVLSGDTAESGYKYIFKVRGSGNGSIAGSGFFEFDNSKTRFRYVKMMYGESSMDVWDSGDITVKVNDHDLFKRKRGYQHDTTWGWETIIAAHDYDMGVNPPSIIKIESYINGTSAGGGETAGGAVYGTITLSFWGQQL